MPRTAPGKQRFQLILIKPSHYDDDGYVIQWAIASMPSNSLAAVYGLAADANQRQVLGPDVEIDVITIDEINTRVRPGKIAEELKRRGGPGLICFVGVQSNQFPRAIDLARAFRDEGIPVAIGGFHVSGCIAMLPELPPDLRAALDMGISLFAGEAENRLDQLIRDAAAGQLKPIYNFINDLPDIRAVMTPFLPRARVQRTIGHWSTFDAGRGCPFQCSFCTIINVQGRKSRQRSADDVEKIIRANYAQGINRFFITDDDFARNADWEPIFDRIIKLREEAGLDIGLMIQVDALCHKIPNFIEKAARAGVRRVFIGMESINPDALAAAKKKQNKISEYRKLMLAWKKIGVTTFAGYIIGFPTDTPESVRRDIEIIKKELPIDLLEFFCLTPLPGSEDHQTLWKQQVSMDPDMNLYDAEHVVTGHPRMSKEEWHKAYLDAWESFYSPAHIETIMRRAAVTNTGWGRLLGILLENSRCVQIEKIHPMQGGIFRRKYRRERRAGLPIESRASFYPKYFAEIVRKNLAIVQHAILLRKLQWKIERDPNHLRYTDSALSIATNEETDPLEFYSHRETAADATATA